MELSPSQFIRQMSPTKDSPFHFCTRNYPSQIRNNPHPFHVRNVKGFLGLPTRMVETEDEDKIAARRTVEQYVKDSLKRGDWYYKENSYVKKTKDLDSILALQYFTGLQNYSFKEDYLPYLGYRDYYNDWRRQLRNITEATYQPLLDTTKSKEDNGILLQHPNEWLSDCRPPVRSKSMYSDTDRLTTRETRTNSRCSTHRLKSKNPLCGTVQLTPNINELDAVVFMLLADLLQTQSVHLIQTWLSRSSERERALIISMLQSALSKPSPTLETEIQNQRIKTIESKVRTGQTTSQLSRNNASVKTEDSNVLVVEMCENSGTKCEELRPPTSSTFNNSRVQTAKKSENKSRMDGCDSKSLMWIQEESIKT